MKSYVKNGNQALVQKTKNGYNLFIYVWAMNPIEVTKNTKREVINTLKSWSLI